MTETSWTNKEIESQISAYIDDNDETIDTDWMIDNWLRSQLETGCIDYSQFLEYHRMTHNEYICRANDAHLSEQIETAMKGLDPFLRGLTSLRKRN